MANELLPSGAAPENPFIGRRKAAHAAGARYYTRPGSICKNGHIPTVRFSSNHACIECDAEWREKNKADLTQQRRDFYHQNKERLTAKQRARYANNPDLWKRLAKKNAAENPERRRITLRAWQDKNADYLRAYYAQWSLDNPDKAAAKAHKRRAAKLGSTEHFTGSQVQKLFKTQKGKCAYCNERLSKSYHRDHITPLSKGGSNGIKNIALACASCNLRKRDMDLPEFAQRYLNRLI